MQCYDIIEMCVLNIERESLRNIRFYGTFYRQLRVHSAVGYDIVLAITRK